MTVISDTTLDDDMYDWYGYATVQDEHIKKEDKS